MMGARFTTQRILASSVAGLAGVLVVGGMLAALVESMSLARGLWLMFNVITTLGFGPPPITSGGQMLVGGAFVVAAVCWFGIVSMAVELALTRFERRVLVREVLRPLSPPPSAKLFQDN